MSGVQADTQFAGCFGCFHKWGNSRFRILRICRSIGFRIKFHTVGTCFCRIFHHLRIGGNKDGSTDACAVELIENFRQKFQICFCIPTGVGSNLRRIVRNQRHLMRFHFQYQVYKLRRRVALDIEFSPQQRTQIIYICPADVAFVGTGMNSNTVSPESFTIKCYLHHIGGIPSACISQCSNLVYVYT